ncbi:MAG: SUMF1/EgtB/PvdO family nonheme iron enzyme [Caldilineaceae bacterium]
MGAGITVAFQRRPVDPPPEIYPQAPVSADRRPPAGSETPVIDLLRTDAGARRLMATRMALDDALERWWTNGELPALGLLRDGLLLLEAGHSLDETQRSFLLRVALRRQRGMITALRYQTDPDRTAFLLKDSLLDTRHPLPPQVVLTLQQEDAQSAIWIDYLLHDLAYEAKTAQGERRQVAVKALAQLQKKSILWSTAAAGAQLSALPLSYRWSLRWLLWGICVLGLALGYVALQRTVYARSVQIPAGSYTISDPLAEGRMHTVVLTALRLDVTEVTNGAYQRCYQSGVCPAPNSGASATRPVYFMDPAYADFPVVNVDWESANTYCTWLGKRLPTVEEWEVAAGIAPLTQQYFRYPWGDQFEPHYVNGGTDAATDTQAVGAFHPLGDSLFGVQDMAGNVAEWTRSSSADLIDGFIVKGGSYQDDALLLRLDAQQNFVRTTQAAWLGFRCVRD